MKVMARGVELLDADDVFTVVSVLLELTPTTRRFDEVVSMNTELPLSHCVVVAPEVMISSDLAIGVSMVVSAPILKVPAAIVRLEKPNPVRSTCASVRIIDGSWFRVSNNGMFWTPPSSSTRQSAQSPVPRAVSRPEKIRQYAL